MTKEITYTTALAELQQIVHDLENELVSIDELSEKVKRATDLLEICKSKLKSTEEEIEKHA